MKIGELAQLTGLSSSRIRYYEGIGILPEAKRMSNGYRAYSREAVEVLRLVVIGKRAGFSLDEIRTLLPQNRSNWDHKLISEILDSKISEIEKKEARLASNKALLQSIQEALGARPDGMECDDNKKRILSFIIPD